MQKYVSYLIIPITFTVFLISLDWGLPTQDRFKQVFGTENNFENRKKEYQLKESTGTLTPYDQIIYGRSNLAVSFPYAGDEHYVLDGLRKLNPYKLKFDPGYYMYGGGFMYTEAAFLQLASWVKFLKIVRDFDYYKKHPEEVGKAYFVMRFAVVVFAATGIFLVFCLARKFFGYPVAFLSWFILFVMPMTHQATHTAEPHIFVLPFFILSFYFCLNSMAGNQKKNCLLAAVFSGLTIGTQATSLYIVCPFGMSLYVNYRNKRMDKNGLLKSILLYSGVSIAVFFLINPFYLINYKGMIADLTRGSGNQLVINFKSWASSQLSWFLMFLFPVTAGYGVFKARKNKVFAVFMSCIVPGIAVYFLTNYHMPYVYSTAALLSVLTAFMLCEIFKNMKKSLRAVFAGVVLLLLVVFPLGRSVYYYLNFTSENSDAAGRWINQNVIPGTVIGVFYPPSLWDCVPFNYHNYKLVDYRQLDTVDSDLPKFIITSAQPPSLPPEIISLYEVEKMYKPRSLFGHHYKLKGELQALIAKTTIIYSCK